MAMEVRLKNMSEAPAVVYDANGKAQTIAVNRTEAVQMNPKVALKLFKISQHGGALKPLNMSDVYDALKIKAPVGVNADPVEEKKPATESRDAGGKLHENVRRPGVQEKPVAEIGNKRKERRVVEPTIKNVGQLLERMASNDPLGYPQLLSVATRILPPDTLDLRPTKAKIIATLKKHHK